MTAAATLAQLASSGALSADTLGNVGVGGNNSGAYGKLGVLGSGYQAAYVQSNDASGVISVLASNSSTETRVGSISNHPLYFMVNGDSKARIDTSGNLLVGGASIPAAGSGARTYFTTVNGYAQAIQRTGSDGPQVAYINAAGNLAGRIDVSGTTCSLFSVSDYRLKENIQPVVGALDKVAQLKPCTYTWKESGNEEQGFIAHELKEVIPSCVSGDKDAVDDSSNIIPQAVSMNASIISTLTAAIQELKAELDVCKAEIAALKGV